MKWARDDECVVFTHDLDFGILLAHTKDRRRVLFRLVYKTYLPKLWARQWLPCCAHTATRLRRELS